MVVEINRKDGTTVYLCESCGDRFDDRDEAAEHEEYCGPPRSM